MHIGSYSDSGVLPGRGDPLAVGAELNTVDPVGVSLVGEDAPLPPDVPQLDGLVGRSGGQEVAVGVEVGAGQAGLARCITFEFGGLFSY